MQWNEQFTCTYCWFGGCALSEGGKGSCDREGCSCYCDDLEEVERHAWGCWLEPYHEGRCEGERVVK